jgi:hypothetical protein
MTGRREFITLLGGCGHETGPQEAKDEVKKLGPAKCRMRHT